MSGDAMPSFKRDHRPKFQLRLPSIVAILLTLVITSPCVAQDRMTLGPRQFEEDKSGSGAVLCSYAVLLATKEISAACKIPREPIDEALDKAIVEIDSFIIANSSLRPTKSALEAFKREVAQSELASVSRSGLDKYCKGDDLAHFRLFAADKLESSIKALLAIPREPTMNPCL